jgi:hypothetical protein
METRKTKLKPFHIILIVVMSALSIFLYLNKDKLLPNPNAAYEELYSTFLQAEGTIMSSENSQGRRSGVIYTIQFRDKDNNLVTVTENSWQTMRLKSGDKVTMYYNPNNPQEATPESRWREIMRK